MKVCSICLSCYDDSIAVCAAEDNSLTHVREGNCRMVKGYRIDSRLESGSPCELYRGTHLASEKSVLVRFIETGDSLADLEDELRAVSGINHPNLARVFEFGEAVENEFYVVSEDMPGKNLRDYLEKSQLSESQAIKIVRQIAEGLEELHAAGLTHRLISLENIYLTNPEDERLSVKLQNHDFGGLIQKAVVLGANGVDSKTEVLRYFSPEQFADETVDFTSDLYSLAVVFYEMLLGSSPYDSLNPQAVADYVFNESDLANLHFDLRALIAYTLRESFQHRLDMRPKTTNNFMRQLRHLELIANRSRKGLQESTQEQVTEPQPASAFVSNKMKPVENSLAREKIVSSPEPITSDAPEEETLVRQVTERKVETDDLNEDSPIEIFTETKPVVVESEVVKAAPIPEYAAQSHIEGTKRKMSETVGTEESEFVKEPVNKEKRADPLTLYSLGDYSQPRVSSGGKTLLYIAGILVSAVFGGLFTAGMLDWGSDARPSVTAQRADEDSNNKDDSSLDQKREIADSSEQDPNSSPIQEPLKNDLQKTYKTVTENSSEKTVVSRTKNKTRPTKKRGVKRRSKPKRKLAAGKTHKTAAKSDGQTRPRIVSKVVIRY